MLSYEFPVSTPLNYHFTGKFEAPTPDWKHENMPLDDYELILVTAGTLYMQYGTKRYTVNQGSALLLAPDTEKKLSRSGWRASPCSFYWLHFHCEKGVSTMNIDGTLPFEGAPLNRSKIILPETFSPSNPERLLVLLKQLQDAVRMRYHPLMLNYMVTVILGEVHTQFTTSVGISTPKAVPQTQIYHDILDYIKRNLHERLTVTQIAQHFGYNEKYVSYMFSKQSGMALKQYILHSKINEANFLLVDTMMPVAEVAENLGFKDSHNFMRCYKKITGLTPSEYRNAFSHRMLFHK